MTDLATVLNALRRPKILIRAARAGVVDYRRDRDLKRLLRDARAPRRTQAIGTLLAEENRLEATRTAGEATYSIQRHVAVLTAILAEARAAARRRLTRRAPPRAPRGTDRRARRSPLAIRRRRGAQLRAVTGRLIIASNRTASPGAPARRRARGRARRRARRARRRRLVRLVRRDRRARDPRRAALRRGQRRLRARRPDPGRVRRLLPRLRQPRALAGLPLPRRPRPLRRGRLRRLRGGQPPLRPAARAVHPARRHRLGARLPLPADGPGDARSRAGTGRWASSCTSPSRRPRSSPRCRSTSASPAGSAPSTSSASRPTATPRTSAAISSSIAGGRCCDDGRLRVFDRTLRAETFSIGIDPDEIAALADRPRRPVRRRAALGRIIENRALVIGVDRMDYSKGLPQRMEAFGRMLDDHPELHGQRQLPADRAALARGGRRLPGAARGARPPRRADQRRLRRPRLDADPLPRPRLLAATRSPASTASPASASSRRCTTA